MSSVGVGNPFKGMSLQHMKRTEEYRASQDVRDDVMKFEKWMHKTKELESTLAFARSAHEMHKSNTRFVAQMLQGISKEGPVEPITVETQQTLLDVGGEEEKEERVSTSIKLSKPSDLMMEGFIERPVEIGNYIITVGTDRKSVV